MNLNRGYSSKAGIKDRKTYSNFDFVLKDNN